MINAFLSPLFSLFKNPKPFVIDGISNKNPQLLNFTFTLILLIAGSEYIGFLNSSSLGSVLSPFSYIIFMAFYVGYFFLQLFVESSITGYFLKNRNVTPFPFGSKQIFMIVSLSYFPYLLFPAVSVISLFLGGGFYLIAFLIAFIGILWIRRKFLIEYQDYFSVPLWFVVTIPVIIQMILGFFILFFIGSIFTLVMYKEFQMILNEALKSSIF